MTTPTKQPKPPTDTLPRVYRAGSWYITTATYGRAAYRFGVTPLFRSDDFGFRCAQRGCRQPVLKGLTPP